jgi:4-amino-4-deoxy-L-arabinose transferase-like glycosyltransferase
MAEARTLDDEPSSTRLEDKPSSSRSAVLYVIIGWLLLIAGLVVLGQEQAPELLATPDKWIQSHVADFQVDAPMPASMWLIGSLLLVGGMVLVGRMKANVPGLTDALRLDNRFPVDHEAKRVGTDTPMSFLWFALVLAGNLIWLVIVLAAGRNSTHWSLVPLWLVAIVIQGVCWWQVDRFAIPSWRAGARWLPTAGIVIAFAILLYRLGDVPNSIWGDEGAFWVAARDLAAGAQANPFALGVYGAYPFISSLYQSLWLRLFGPTLWSWRLSSVVIGTLTIIPLVFLVRRLLGSRVAWSAAVLMVSRPYFLAFTRMGYNNIQPLLPTTVGLWLLIEALQGYSHALAYLSGISLGIASLTYTAGHIGLVIAVLFVLFLLTLGNEKRPLRRSTLRLALCLGIGWLFAAGPFFLGGALSGNVMGGKGAESFFGSAFYGEALFSSDQLTRLYPLLQIGQHRIFFEPRLYALLIVRGLVRTGLSMVADKVATQHYLVGPLAGPGVAFFLAGLSWLLRRIRRWQAALWIIWTLACVLLLSAFNTFPPRATHLVPIIPVLAVLTAVGIWLLSSLLRQILRCLWADWIAVGLTVALALWGFRIYFTVMPRRYTPDLQNVMFWRAQEMEPGSHLVFVVDAPYPADFRVKDIDEFRLDVNHHTLPLDEVGTTDFRVLCGRLGLEHDPACRVFFLPGEDADAVETELRRQLGDGTVERHTDALGWTVGLEFVPDYSDPHLESGSRRSDLYWNGILALGALVAVLLSPVPARALFTGFLSYASRGAIAVRSRVTSLRSRWAGRTMPALFLGCLVCSILGQAYFTGDFVQSRQEPGPNWWPGLFFYGLSIIYFLLLFGMIKEPFWARKDSRWARKDSRILPACSHTSPGLEEILWGDLFGQRWRIGLLCAVLIAGVGLSWDLGRRSPDASYVFPFMLWMAMMAAYLAVFARIPSWIWQRRGIRIVGRWIRINSGELCTVLILVIVAFLFRAYAVGSIPYSVGGDEASFGLRAIEFLEGTRTNMFAISEWYSNPNFPYFCMALPLALMGRTITGLRMLAILAGTASVLLTYLLTRQFLGKQAALVSAFFLAAQHYHLHFSRLGSSNVFDTLFAPLLAYLLARGLQRRRSGLFAAAGLTLGLAQYFYFGARMLPILVLVVMGYVTLVRRDLLRANLANLGILGLGAVLAFLPLGVYELGHPGSLLGRVSQVSIFHSGWLANEAQVSGKSVLQIVGNAFLRSSLAFNYFTDQSFWYRSSIPFLDPISAVLFVIGLVAAMRYAFRNVSCLLLVAWFWLAVVFGGTLTILPPASERLVIITPALAVLVTLGLTQLVEFAQTTMAAWFRPMSRFTLFIATIVLMLVNIGYYFLSYTPTHVYGNPTAEMLTRLSRELDTSQQDGRVYFWGVPTASYESATVPRFLRPEIEGVDVPPDWAGDLSFVDTRQRAWFVFLPERLAELETVRASYPGGITTPVYSVADERLLYVLYEPSGER